MIHFFRQLTGFTLNQVLSCLFPVVIFLTLAVSKLIHISWLPRYDFILLICLLMQCLMVWSKLETAAELRVICVFHLIGLCLELFKIHMGSWAYPEHAWSKVGGVPLYSGFMYASVASYICQAWRRFNLKISGWPPLRIILPMAMAIYLNFFLHHFFIDLRWVVTVCLLIVFYRTHVIFKVNGADYRMPMMLSFGLIGFFIWIAENISTFFGAWQYPDQAHIWHIVHFGKISSWFLLVIISTMIIVMLKQGRKTPPYRTA